MFSSAILVSWGALVLLGSWFPLKPNEMLLSQILLPPTSHDWLGFDDYGRSIADRLLMGARTSFVVAFAVVTVSAGFGTAVGILSAWLGGWWDLLIVRLIDVFLAFPGMLLAIALAGLLGPGVDNVVVALAAVGWVSFARLARAQALSVKEREHVQAAQSLGVSSLVTIYRHVLPLISAPLIIEATFGIAGVVVAEAGLSFLGLGVQPPAPSWGGMIRDGTRYMLVAPHMVIAPGIAMMLVVLAANLTGDWMRDRLDVRGLNGTN
ncbi:MAG: ABC transporter permease [Gammaproteobacteria bacterium]